MIGRRLFLLGSSLLWTSGMVLSGLLGRVFAATGSTPLRVVTTRGEAQADAQADERSAANNAQRFRMRLFIGAGGLKAGTARLILSAFYVPADGETDGSAYQTSAHIEFAGQAYPFKWNDSFVGSVPAGSAEILSDPLADIPDVAAGTEAWLLLERRYEIGGSPIYVFSKGANPHIDGEDSQEAPQGTSSQVGQTGPIPRKDGWKKISNAICPPFVIVGEQLTHAPAFVVAAASIEKRQNDTWGDGANGAGGYMRRGLNPTSGTKYAFIMLAKASESCERFLSDCNKRSVYFKYATYPIIGYGGNDYTKGRTTAETLTDLLELSKIMKGAANTDLCGFMRMAPKTDSTDGWSTVARQTVRQGHQEFRSEIDHGVVDGSLVLIDVTAAYEDSEVPGIWRPGCTEDGTHPSPEAHGVAASILQALLVNLASDFKTR